ncbi:Fic family protein [Sphingobacterium sp. lm-10]|uniref:type II toxin-antitoxin system death-on-curing family toxin n=1 Tax=Sphingobacterium sp. lm-10 TaxID=2944904 RepID=UPI0020206746|nr:Fic family protein [Sphingobacterium sp. lm-10]MCL7989401.1 Fic family protein [Sphingobacterium sp. lm-10]
MAFHFFRANDAIKIHDKIIEISGGRAGIKDYGNIDSPLVHIQNDDYYPTFEKKLTHLIFAFNKFHAFNDGNKRTSIAMGAFFLEVNGLDVIVNKFIIEMENIAVAIADNAIGKDLLSEIVSSLLNEEDYNEQLKLKIVNALKLMGPDNKHVNLGEYFSDDIY